MEILGFYDRMSRRGENFVFIARPSAFESNSLIYMFGENDGSVRKSYFCQINIEETDNRYVLMGKFIPRYINVVESLSYLTPLITNYQKSSGLFLIVNGILSKLQ